MHGLLITSWQQVLSGTALYLAILILGIDMCFGSCICL